MFKSSIDSVISDISSKVGKLRDLAEKHDFTAGVHFVKSRDHKIMHDSHLELRNRATRIASKFEELLK